MLRRGNKRGEINKHVLGTNIGRNEREQINKHV
jgi:hypothetical protein